MTSEYPIAPSLNDRLNAFRPAKDAETRILALFSATIAQADDEITAAAIRMASSLNVSSEKLYEIVLQSYLFLGFPRMLRAAEVLQANAPFNTNPAVASPPTQTEITEWFDRGTGLCQTVYGDTYNRLRDRVLGIAPDIFRWMILEGYGKVLSRPGVDSVTRELCIVTSLMIDNRPAQLHSHMRGSLNVGAPWELLVQVVDDIGDAAGPGYAEARAILRQLEAA